MSDLIDPINNIINTSAWLLDDKEWVKSRKAKWRELSKLLKEDKILVARDLNLYKQYFLTGVIDADYYEVRAPSIYSIYILMFHADQSEHNLFRLFEQLKPILQDHGTSLDQFKHIGSPWISPGINEQGYLDGNEAIYCKLLYGETEEQYATLREAKSKTMFGAFCESAIRLTLNIDCYKYIYYQFLLDFSFYCSKNVDYSRLKSVEVVSQFLVVIAYYEELDPFKGVDEERYQAAWNLVNQVREKLQSENLPDELKTRWQYAQTPEGKAQEYEFYQEKYPLLKQLTKSELV